MLCRPSALLSYQIWRKLQDEKETPDAAAPPVGMYRCQITVVGERKSVVDADPDICQAKAVALKSGMIEEQKNP